VRFGEFGNGKKIGVFFSKHHYCIPLSPSGWIEYTKNGVVCQATNPQNMEWFLKPSRGDKMLNQKALK
jgi:hypothetical protein